MAGIPTNVAQLMAVLNLNTLPFEANAAKAAGMMSSGGLLAMGAAGLGVIMAGTGIIATKMAGDFQAGLTSLVTGAGESQKNLQMVSDGILQLSMDTGTSTKQLIDGMYMIESGGFHGAAGLNILKAAAEGAKVGNADLGTVADATDTILKNYGEHGALTAIQATNTLITTVANGKTHLEDLASSLSAVLPAASAAGIGLNDVMAGMATMTNVGIPAAESATYLRQLIVSLSAPTAGARGEMDRLGISMDVLTKKMHTNLGDALQYIVDKLHAAGIKEGSQQWVAAIRDIAGGQRQMQGLLVLTQHLDTVKSDITAIGKASSSTSNQVTGWALVQQNLNQQFDRFKNTLGVLLINLGTQLLPVATALFGFLADKALPAIKNLAQWLGDRLGEASKAVAQGWHDLTSKGGFLYAAIQTLPGILAGIHHYFDLLGQVWRTQIQPGLVQMLPVLKVIGAILAVVIVGAVATTVVAFLLLVGAITAVIFILVKIGQGIGWLFSKFGVFKQGIQVTINAIGAVLGWLGEHIGALQATVGNFVGHALGKLGELKDHAIKKIQDMVNGIGRAVTSLPGKMLTLGEDLLKKLAQGLQNGRSAVVSALSNIPLIGGLASNINKLIPKFAAQGGTFSEGEWGVVGEDNPEAIRVQNGRAIITPLSGGRLAASPAGMGSSSSGTAGGTLVVKLYVDGKQVTQAILPHLTPAIRAIGNRRF